MASYNPTFQINLNSLFDSSFRGRSTEQRRELKKIIKRNEFKSKFKQRIIRTIRDNTRLKSKDKDGDRLQSYSKSYKESEEFQVLKGSTKVNLTLTGEMLESIEGVSRGDNVVFQFKRQRNKDIAHGHINGSNNLPVRDFFGIPEKQQQTIMKDLVKFYQTRNQIFENSDIKPESVNLETNKVETFREETSLTGDIFEALEVGFFE